MLVNVLSLFVQSPQSLNIQLPQAGVAAKTPYVSIIHSLFTFSTLILLYAPRKDLMTNMARKECFLVCQPSGNNFSFARLRKT